MSAEQYLQKNREIFQRIPGLLKDHPAEAEAVENLNLAVIGDEVSADVVPQCGILFRSGIAAVKSAVFLGSHWVLTASHNIELDGNYSVMMPVATTSDFSPEKIFEVNGRVPGTVEPQLTLLHLKTSPPVANMAMSTAVVVDTAARLCGFGSDSCSCQSPTGNNSASGKKRLSTARQILSATASRIVVEVGVNEALVCRSDSGGALLMGEDADARLVGIINWLLCSNDEPKKAEGVECIRLNEDCLSWIHAVTGLPI